MRVSYPTIDHGIIRKQHSTEFIAAS